MRKIKKIIAIVMATMFVLVMGSTIIFAGNNDAVPYGYTDIDAYLYVTSETIYNSSADGVVTGVQLFACYSDYDYVNVAGSSTWGTSCSTGYDFSSIYNVTDGAYSDHHYGINGEFTGVTWSSCSW